MQSQKTLLNTLRRHGLKITPQRRMILEILNGDHSHPTADQIYKKVISVLPDVSRTTIYNTLRELVGLELLTEVNDLHSGGIRYDTNPSVHHHLYCTRCQTLIDFDRNFEGLTLTPEEKSGYQITRHQVTFFGICPECQSREDDNKHNR